MRAQHYDYQSLPLLRKPLWIVVAGTSVNRGDFLMLIDKMLRHQIQSYPDSTVKCWGWIDFRMGNFRLSYLDFRAHSMFKEKAATSEYTVPVSQNYTRQAQLRLLQLGKEQPDVFFLLVVS